MERRTLKIAATPLLQTREETFNGRSYLVVPVVALVEGVVHAMNSASSEFVAAEEFQKAPFGWNGRPVFHGHPLNAKGRPVSGNSPEVLEEKSIGIVFNASASSTKLKMEAWLDKERTATVAPTLLERIKDGQPIEISVGTFVETDDEAGEYNGVPFAGSWHDLVPDHLALLPADQVGACSREMGCGVRAARGASMNEWYDEFRTLRNIPQAERDKMSDNDFAGPNRSFPIAEPEDVAAAAKALGRLKGGNATQAQRDAVKKKIIAIAYRKGSDFVAQLPDDWKKKKDQKNASLFAKMLGAFRANQPASEMSDTDVRRELSEALRTIEPAFSYVEAVYDDRVIYAVYTPGTYATCFFQRVYALDANGEAALTGDRVEVEPVLIYEPVVEDPTATEQPEPVSAVGKRHSQKDQDRIQAMHDQAVALGADCPMPDGTDPKAATSAAQGAPCSCQAGAPTAATMQKEYKMEKDQIVAFLEKATPEQLKAMSDLAEGKTPEPKAAAAVPAEPKVPTFAELVAAAEPDTRDMINRGLAVAREQKNATIKALKDTGRCAFSDEELAAMSQERLDQLTQLASVKVATDFGVNVPKQTPANEVKTAPAAPDLTERIKAAAKK